MNLKPIYITDNQMQTIILHLVVLKEQICLLCSLQIVKIFLCITLDWFMIHELLMKFMILVLLMKFFIHELFMKFKIHALWMKSKVHEVFMNLNC